MPKFDPRFLSIGRRISIRENHGEACQKSKPTLQPLTPFLAAQMRRHVSSMKMTDGAFPGMSKTRGAEMLRVDLEAAGIPYINEAGQHADFHSFRYTFAQLLHDSGIPLVKAQKLMHHSDPCLTANIYTKMGLTEKTDEVARISDIFESDDDGDNIESGGLISRTFFSSPPEVREMPDLMDTITTYTDDEIGESEEAGKDEKPRNRRHHRPLRGKKIGGERGILRNRFFASFYNSAPIWYFAHN